MDFLMWRELQNYFILDRKILSKGILYKKEVLLDDAPMYWTWLADHQGVVCVCLYAG